MNTQHIPVLCDRVLEFLKPQPTGVYVDGTVGLGGHSSAILNASAPTGRVIGIDLDSEALAIAKKRLSSFEERCNLINGNFAEMHILLQKYSIYAVDGVLLDLGVSSLQLDTPHRGFSFKHPGPLDMRMRNEHRSAHDQTVHPTAMQIVNNSSMDTLVGIFKRYAEERFSKRIAARIVKARQLKAITTTTHLAEIIKSVVPQKRSKIHPATRVFQALRIHVNSELENLEAGLDAAIGILNPGGCFCVITFHSLEDRIVKRRFQRCAKECLCPPKTPICICGHKPSLQILTKRPIVSDASAIQHNPRARSAKLRAARKL